MSQFGLPFIITESNEDYNSSNDNDDQMIVNELSDQFHYHSPPSLLHHHHSVEGEGQGQGDDDKVGEGSKDGGATSPPSTLTPQDGHWINPSSSSTTPSVAITHHHHQRTHSLPQNNGGYYLPSPQPLPSDSPTTDTPTVTTTTTTMPPSTSILSSSAPHPSLMSTILLSPPAIANSILPAPIIKEKVSHRKKPTSAPTKPPRPPNAWILYRSHCAKTMKDSDPHAKWSQGELSKLFATQWRAETPEVKRSFVLQAEVKKEEHVILYAGRKWPAPIPTVAATNAAALKAAKAVKKLQKRAAAAHGPSTSSFDGYAASRRGDRTISWGSSAASSVSPAGDGRYLSMELGETRDDYDQHRRWASGGSTNSSSYPVGDGHSRSTSTASSGGMRSWPSVLFGSAPSASMSGNMPAYSIDQPLPHHRAASAQNPPTHLHPSTAASASSAYAYSTHSHYLSPSPAGDLADSSSSVSSETSTTIPSFAQMNYPPPSSSTNQHYTTTAESDSLDTSFQPQYWNQNDGTRSQQQRSEQARHYAHAFVTSGTQAGENYTAGGAGGGGNCSMEFQQSQSHHSSAPISYYQHYTEDDGDHHQSQQQQQQRQFQLPHQHFGQSMYENESSHHQHHHHQHQQQMQTPDREMAGPEYWSH